MGKGINKLVIIIIIVFSGLFIHCSFCADLEMWETVDIVPMPKEIKLTGNNIPVNESVIIIGNSVSEQGKIGAKWLNDKIIELGGKPLPVLPETEKIPDGKKLRIIIGSPETSSLIKKAVEQGILDFKPDKPGPKGYLIRTRKQNEATDIFLSGVDNIGTLYACVTLAELMEKQNNNLVIREAVVTDWPDFLKASLGTSNIGGTALPELGKFDHSLNEKQLTALKKQFDRLLRWKVSLICLSKYLHNWQYIPESSWPVLKEALEYGKARGIGSLVTTYAMAGHVKHHHKKGIKGSVREWIKNPSVKRRHPVKWNPQWLRCWSWDDMRRETARKLARFLNGIGATDLYLHDTDGGGFENPAYWNDRCETCRKRWGNDYVSATANKYQIYYDEIKKLNPEIIIHAAIYPYTLSVLTQESAEECVNRRYGSIPGKKKVAENLKEKLSKWYTEISAKLPDDVTICHRESLPENVQEFRKLTAPHASMVYFKLLSGQWVSFFSEMPAMTGSFYKDKQDLFYPPTLEMFLPLQALATREYAWNINAPGAKPYNRLPTKEQWKHCLPKGKIYSVVLPHVVRNFLGREIASEVTKAVSFPISPEVILEKPYRSRELLYLTKAEEMAEQAEMAAESVRLLDQAWKKVVSSKNHLGITPFALRRLMCLRETVHAAMWMAKIRTENKKARKLATQGKLAEAEKCIARGLAFIPQAEANAKRLIGERLDDPVFKGTGLRAYDQWLSFTAGKVDFSKMKDRLIKTQKSLPFLRTGSSDKKLLKKIENNRKVIAVNKELEQINIDGKLSEPIWKKAVAIGSFMVFKKNALANADTEVMTLYDSDKIYFGFVCNTLGNQKVQAAERKKGKSVIANDDSAEIFLVPSGQDQEYFHIMFNAAGSLQSQKCLPLRNKYGATRVGKCRTSDWFPQGMEFKTNTTEGKWTAELVLPLSALNIKPVKRSKCTINLCRNYPEGNVMEYSSLLPSTSVSFHDCNSFRPLIFNRHEIPKPEIKLEVSDFKVYDQCLDEGQSTIVKSKFNIDANCILHDVNLKMEAYDENGKLLKTENINLTKINYLWKSPKTYRLVFGTQVKQGGVKLVLNSNEGDAERWIRIKGWQGTKALGNIYEKVNGFFGTTVLNGCFFFPSEVFDGKIKNQLFNSTEGTIEFWMKPTENQRTGSHCYIQFGPVAQVKYPTAINTSPFIINGSEKKLYFCIFNRQYAGWLSPTSKIKPSGEWRKNWHHIACVWDAKAEPEQQLRLYIDGQESPGPGAIRNAKRLGENTSVKIQLKNPYAIQIGCLNNGYNACNCLIDELRISKTARYNDNFKPVQKEFELDNNTSALFHFNENLNGKGMISKDKSCIINGTAGIWSVGN